MLHLCFHPTCPSRKQDHFTFKTAIFQLCAIVLFISVCLTPYAQGSSHPIHRHDFLAAQSLIPVITVQITPGSASISSSTSFAFYATVKNTSDTAVTWKATVGKISSAGLY